MAQNANIALTLRLGGVDVAIKNIKEFEAAIAAANQKLQTTIVPGTDAYKTFAAEIKTASSRLKDFKKEAEGQEVEQRLGGYAKLGSAITSSFAAAQIAVSLFGSESESITKAATTAQQALTLALVGREIAEAAVELQSIKNALATQLETAATNSANVATKAFFKTLAANPYAIILTGIGLVVTALIALTSRTNEAAKANAELTKQVNETAGKEIAQYRILTQTVNNSNVSLGERQKALKQLKEQFPGYFKNLEDEEILNGKVKVAIKGVEDAILSRARASAYAGRIEQNTITLLGLEEKLVLQQQALADATRNLESVQRNITSYGQGAAAALQGASKGVSANRAALQSTEAQINKLNQENAKYEKSIQGLTENTDDLTGAVYDNSEALRKQEQAQQQYLEGLKERYSLQLQVLEGLGKLNEGEAKISAEVLERANKFLDDANTLREKRNEFFKTEQEQFTTELRDLLFTVIPTGADLATLQDRYIGFFGKLERTTQEGAVQLFDETGKAIRFTQEEVIKQLEGFGFQDVRNIWNKLSKEAQDAYILYLQRFAQTVEKYKNIRILDQVFTFDPTALQKNLGNAIQQTVKILDDASVLDKETALQEIVQGIFQFPTKSLKDFSGSVDEQKIKLEQYNAQVSAVRENIVSFLQVQAKQSLETQAVNKDLVTTISELLKIRNELGDVSELDLGIIDPNKFLLPLEQQAQVIDFIIEKLKESPELVGTVLNLVATNYEGFIARFGEEGLGTLVQGIGTAFENLDGLSAEQLLALETNLLSFKSFIVTTFSPEVVAAFEDLLKRIGITLSKIPTEAQIAWNKSLEEFKRGLQEFQGVLNNLGQTFSDFYSAQLDNAAMKNTYLQKQIVDGTEQANNKRIELEQQYQTKKARLEKQAARTSLLISLVQATANVAESITAALKSGIPVVSQLAAAANAAIGAVQVGIISSQLIALNQYKRGGYIKGQQGFMVNGPSHEFGGVKFQQGGVELEGGEAVINRQSAIQYQGLLSQINQSGGGRPLVMNNFDDSRLLEAIAKQRNEPIRAYVVEQDITNKQTIAKRLEQLAQY